MDRRQNNVACKNYLEAKKVHQKHAPNKYQSGAVQSSIKLQSEQLIVVIPNYDL